MVYRKRQERQEPSLGKPRETGTLLGETKRDRNPPQRDQERQEPSSARPRETGTLLSETKRDRNPPWGDQERQEEETRREFKRVKNTETSRKIERNFKEEGQ